MNGKISIRSATLSDSTQIHELLNALGYEKLVLPELESTLEMVFSRSDMFLKVADLGAGALAGYVLYSIKPQPRLVGQSIEIDELSVSPEYRGSGVGTRLLDKVKKHALSVGARRIILSTNRQRESYRRSFYQKHGFTEKDSAWMSMSL